MRASVTGEGGGRQKGALEGKKVCTCFLHKSPPWPGTEDRPHPHRARRGRGLCRGFGRPLGEGGAQGSRPQEGRRTGVPAVCGGPVCSPGARDLRGTSKLKPNPHGAHFPAARNSQVLPKLPGSHPPRNRGAEGISDGRGEPEKERQ